MGISGEICSKTRIIRDNRGMEKKDETGKSAENELHIIIADEEELTPKELAQERKAALEEHKRLTWLSQTPEQLAGRIPVSVFAMGALVAAS
jgi:hypothetical protein